MGSLILDSKRDDEQEYTLHLFTNCNLRCSFCWQDHESMVGVDDILDKLPIYKDLIYKEKKDRLVFNVMGGEVFSDTIFDKRQLDTYKVLCTSLIAYGKEVGKTVKINWVTNLVFENKENFDDLLNWGVDGNIDQTFTVSYDPRGRFNRSQLSIFSNNLFHYGPSVIKTVGMMFTKNNIKHLMSKIDPLFEKIYSLGFKINFDYLMPDGITSEMPSDEDMLSFIKFLIDKYPKVEPVSEWLKKQTQTISCRSSKLVLEDGTVCGCGNLIDKEVAKEIYVVDIDKSDNTNIEEKFIERYGCLYCEYYSRCQLGCFMNKAYVGVPESSYCVFKEVHHYIDVKTDLSKNIPILNIS